jgi:hypothetical protein
MTDVSAVNFTLKDPIPYHITFYSETRPYLTISMKNGVLDMVVSEEIEITEAAKLFIEYCKAYLAR